MQLHNLVLKEKKQLTENVVELLFEKPEGLTFKAGQFVQFLIPHEGKLIPRSYSICSTPNDSTLNFCVKILENGVASGFFTSMQPGDAVEVKGPLGRFLGQSQAKGHDFVATGVGLAPIMGIIRNQLEQGDKAKMHLVFGVRYPSDIFWQNELDALTKKYPNFSYNITLSRPDDTWGGLSGHVTDHLADHGPEDGHHVYLCGSGDMVKDVKTLLTERGFDSKHIHFEIF